MKIDRCETNDGPNFYLCCNVMRSVLVKLFLLNFEEKQIAFDIFFSIYENIICITA